MSGIKSKLITAHEKALRSGKFKHGFNDLQLEGLQKYLLMSEGIFKPFSTAVDAIQADRTLSPEGKSLKIETLKKSNVAIINGFKAGECDKSTLKVDHQNRVTQKTAHVRKAFKPEDVYLAEMRARELRDNLQLQQAEYLQKVNMPGASHAEKSSDGPLFRALAEAASTYQAKPMSPAAVSKNKRCEAVLTALLDGPYEIVADDMRENIEQGLERGLAFEEVETLREVVGYHAVLQDLANDMLQIVLEA